MGAIARSAANNITTSGVFTSGAIANTSVTGITTLANASDGITFISSQTASNSASISFTTGIDSTYKAYKFVFSNIHLRTNDENFSVNFSTDGGSNYNATKTTTYFRARHTENDVTADLAYTGGFDQAQSTGEMYIADSLSNEADASLSGTLILFNPSSTTYVKHVLGNFNSYCHISLTIQAQSAGYINTTSAVNALRFKMGSGNFDGTIYLYGIK
jgi:hypothetical protein